MRLKDIIILVILLMSSISPCQYREPHINAKTAGYVYAWTNWHNATNVKNVTNWYTPDWNQTNEIASRLAEAEESVSVEDCVIFQNDSHVSILSLNWQRIVPNGTRISAMEVRISWFCMFDYAVWGDTRRYLYLQIHDDTYNETWAIDNATGGSPPSVYPTLTWTEHVFLSLDILSTQWNMNKTGVGTEPRLDLIGYTNNSFYWPGTETQMFCYVVDSLNIRLLYRIYIPPGLPTPLVDEKEEIAQIDPFRRTMYALMMLTFIIGLSIICLSGTYRMAKALKHYADKHPMEIEPVYEERS